MANKKKIATSVAAVAMAAAMLLGGTFAWQSISQTALNEASDIVNPGGRLHDDFDGENKDVYVENFADEPIFARVRLGEYMEIVVNKGMGDNLEKTVEVIGSRNFDADGNVESYNYDVFKNYERDGEFNAGVDKTDPDKSWWTWTTGGSTVYMPTFNLNKDSLQADVNGTLQGPDGVVTDAEDDDRYSDYVTYEDGETLEGLEIYDADSNNIDEVGDNFDNLTQYETAENIVTISADEEGDPISHTAKPTGTAQLISMEEWLAMNDIEAAAAAATTADDPYGVAPAFAANAVATLHYDKNADNATGEITDVEMPYDSELTLSDGSGFTREGYTLVGWNTKADGSGETYALGEADWVLPEGETTLYAVWELDDGTGGGTDDENTQDDEPAYWVYDEDGWVYYSKPIQPHTATGLLLSGIELNEVMDDSWYYAIQVTGQFITADDLGSMEDGTGFYDIDAGNIPSVNALKLLKAIGVEVPENGTTYKNTVVYQGTVPNEANMLSAGTTKVALYDENGKAFDFSEGSGNYLALSIDGEKWYVNLFDPNGFNATSLLGNTSSAIATKLGVAKLDEAPDGMSDVDSSKIVWQDTQYLFIYYDVIHEYVQSYEYDGTTYFVMRDLVAEDNTLCVIDPSKFQSGEQAYGCVIYNTDMTDVNSIDWENLTSCDKCTSEKPTT